MQIKVAVLIAKFIYKWHCKKYTLVVKDLNFCMIDLYLSSSLVKELRLNKIPFSNKKVAPPPVPTFFLQSH
jgi:hypothetical protein